MYQMTGIGVIVTACIVLVLLGVLAYRLVARGLDRGPRDT
jgi:hypothetical protein